jgi:hypothetical protein
MEVVFKICRICAGAMNKHDQRILVPAQRGASLENAVGLQIPLLLLEEQTQFCHILRLVGQNEVGSDVSPCC